MFNDFDELLAGLIALLVAIVIVCIIVIFSEESKKPQVIKDTDCIFYQETIYCQTENEEEMEEVEEDE